MHSWNERSKDEQVVTHRCVLCRHKKREKLIVIGKNQKQQCFGVMKTLPVNYKVNDNGWMIAVEFKDRLRQKDQTKHFSTHSREDLIERQSPCDWYRLRPRKHGLFLGKYNFTRATLRYHTHLQSLLHIDNKRNISSKGWCGLFLAT